MSSNLYTVQQVSYRRFLAIDVFRWLLLDGCECLLDLDWGIYL
jgi:hypothetical protein